MRGILWAGILILVSASATAAPARAGNPPAEDVFHNEFARLELCKPAGWVFMPLDSALAARATVKMKDAEFQRAVLELASAPLVVAARHPEPYESLNPTLQVMLRPLGTLESKSGLDILKLIEPALAAQFTDFELMDEPRTVTVGGLQAARMTLRYRLQTQDGREFPTQATMVVVPRGKALYQIGFSGPWEGPDAITTEVDSVLASVKFLD